MGFKDTYKKYIIWGLTALSVLCGSILFFFILCDFSDIMAFIGKFLTILTPVIIGMIIAYLLSPAINKIESLIFEKKVYNAGQKKRVRILTVILSELLFVFVLIGCFRLIVPQIISSLSNITENYDTYYDNFMKWLTKMEKKYPDLSTQIENFITNDSGKLNDYFNETILPIINDWIFNVTSGIFSALKLIFNFCIGLIISFYLLYNKERFGAQGKKIIFAFMKRERANAFIHNIRFVDKTFNGFIVGKIIDSIIIGFLCYILTKLLGIPFEILISVIVGVTNVIPFFGPFIGAIPCSMLLILIDPLKCLYFIIMIFLLQQFDGNVLGPKILGDSTGLSGFWVIFAITFFGGLWGPTGMIVGVPLFAVIYTIVSAYIKTRLEAKGLTSNTEKYKTVNYIDEDNVFQNIPKNYVTTITSSKKIEDTFYKNVETKPKKKFKGRFFKGLKKKANDADNNSSENEKK